MSRPISPLVVVLLATLGLVGPATAADWSVVPAANRFGSGRQQLHVTVNPGATVRDGIEVANTGAAPLRLSLRAADGLSWLRLDRSDVTVGPGRSVQVPFTVAPPEGARPGDYLGGIVTRAGGQDVGLPIRLRVGGPLQPSLAVEDVNIDGKTVSYTIHNTGNAILTARPVVSVSGPFGRFASKPQAGRATPELLPGQRFKGTTALDDVKPALRVAATVKVLPLITDAAGSTAPLAEVEATGHGWSVPWLPLVPVVLMVGLVPAVRRRRRRVALSA